MRYAHGSFAVQPADAVKDGDAGLAQRCCSVVIGEVLDHPVALGEDGREIRSLVRNDLSHIRNSLGQVEHLDRSKECFARVAAEVLTLPTDQPILDKCYR
ncbi:hypothetical protein A5724_17680 [Mycobacterium sp. ACS1612]|nr:hypothetical protein A5724_17680 [Mycobacterium sp. ACS1612]